MSERLTPAPTVLLLSKTGAVPACVGAWCTDSGLNLAPVADGALLLATVLRSRPRCIIVDASGDRAEREQAIDVCRSLKRDSFMAIVPLLAIVPGARLADAFAAGCDEVLRDDIDENEARARLSTLLRRSDRDTDVHPSTRLPGAREIEAELARRVRAVEPFAACYADLDHFKEFNDRYGYHNGDAVIRLLARILHDVVKGLCGEAGFVGHIGGDDFLFALPLSAMARVCDEVIRTFEELIPLQYSEQDRRVGYFFGKDRRGQLHRVPLMTLSVGVVTNQRRRFTRGVEVSELATEMKSYAKTLPGSVWAVDRRRDEPGVPLVSASGAEIMRAQAQRTGGTGA